MLDFYGGSSAHAGKMKSGDDHGKRDEQSRDATQANAWKKNSGDKGTKNRADSPGKIEKADGAGHVRRRKLCGAQIGGGVAEPVTGPIDGNRKYGDQPGADTEKREADNEEEKAEGQNFGGTEFRKQVTGRSGTEEAAEELSGKEEARLGIRKRPVADEVREQRADERGDQPDSDKAGVEENPFGQG